MIQVVNKKQCPDGLYIGRGSPLGNPFHWGQSKHADAQFLVKDREEAIKEYRVWLVDKLKDRDPQVCDAFRKIQIDHFTNINVFSRARARTIWAD